MILILFRSLRSQNYYASTVLNDYIRHGQCMPNLMYIRMPHMYACRIRISCARVQIRAARPLVGKCARYWWEQTAACQQDSFDPLVCAKDWTAAEVMSVRGRGLPGAIFRGSRLPLTPRTNTGPYVRPSGPMRLPPSQPGRLINVQANSRSSGNDHLHPLTRTNTDDNDQRTKPTLGEILDEVRHGMIKWKSGMT